MPNEYLKCLSFLREGPIMYRNELSKLMKMFIQYVQRNR